MKINTFSFTQNNFIKSALLAAFLVLFQNINAQEFLTGARANTQLFKELNQQRANQAKAEVAPISLPFFEDFSNYVGFPKTSYFKDNQAFVNQTFAVRPPSLGVITLDALNEIGEIYSHLNAVAKGADTLTSRCFRLDSVFIDGGEPRKMEAKDSVYFSFYYQPGGGGVAGAHASENLGNQPDFLDSLVLEFGYLDTTQKMIWKHVWATPGFSISKWRPDTIPFKYFEQVMIPILDTSFFTSTFQFRFRNYASLEPQSGILGWQGNVDQWHLDYFRLGMNRTKNDLFTNDVSFVSPTTSLLKNYQSMPWNQFEKEELKPNFDNQLSNLFNNKLTTTYQYSIVHNGSEIHKYTTGTNDVDPYTVSGLVNNQQLSQPSIDFSPQTFSDTTHYTITHVFQNAAIGDICPANDTCIFAQKFQNYFAYDDGTAEFGYCLNNQFSVGFLAYKVTLNKLDNLNGLQMWFNHTKGNESGDAIFAIYVWNDTIVNGINKPGKVKYKQEGCKPLFDTINFLNFYEYKFADEVEDVKTFWIGFEQYGNVQLNIGFDQNTDSRDHFRYNTRGIWEQSVFKGSPMMRPVFGKGTKNEETNSKKTDIIAYPNPAKDKVVITHKKLAIDQIEVMNMLGNKICVPFNHSQENIFELTISSLQKGIYFIRVYSADKSVEMIKLIKN